MSLKTLETLASTCQNAFTYIAFLLVGTSCGWFVVNSIYNLIANEPRIAEGGSMLGIVNELGSIAGLVLCAIFLLYPFLLRRKISKGIEMVGSSILIVLSLISLILLSVAWRSPLVVKLCGVFGGVVGNGSILLLFPLIATHYSGWLVAPVRAGTDISSMFSAFLAEAQTSDGVNQRFPTWLLFALYGLISCSGLIAWFVILRYGIGLRSQSKGDEAEAESEELQVSKIGLKSLFCPRSLLAPVMMASLTQITQWGIAASLGEIGAEMCDPSSCGGTEGRFVFRLSLTLSQILVPLGSLISSLGPCPRWLFYLISLLQYASCGLVSAAALGIWREMWISKEGQIVFITSFALCGMLEGYVITMAYRYIGDALEVPLAYRHSAGALLSIATVIMVSTTGLFLGAAVGNGDIQCIDP